MDTKEIDAARKRYSEILKEKQQLENIKNRIIELEQDSNVREYINLVNLINKENRPFNEESMAYEAFYDISKKTKYSNQIFVYMGAYQISVYNMTQLVYEKDADYISYEDLETGLRCNIDPCEKSKFENNHKVIYLNKSIINPMTCSGDYYKEGITKLRGMFFKRLLNQTQDEIIKQLVK